MAKQNQLPARTQKLLPRDLSESLGKMPPSAVELEEAVLGACLLERNALHQVVDVLHPEDFFMEVHKEIWQAMTTLFQADQPVDMRTAADQLRKTGKIELVGGAYYIAELTSKVSSAANVEYHARVVAEMAIKRRVIGMANELHHEAYEDTCDAFVLLDDAQMRLDEVSGRYIRSMPRSAKVIYQESINQILLAQKLKGIVGVPSGYTLLDRLTGGWRAPDLIIIAARPGMGKTAVVTCLARNATVDFKIPVAVFSLEMSETQLMDRLISSEAQIDLSRIIKGPVDDYELTIIGNKTGRLANAPLFIDGTPALTILELRAKARRLKNEHGIKMIIVDYLQLMRGDQSGNREQEISSISRALKSIAKELNIPVIALSQLSRAVETRGGDKRPMLSDLRDSGAIEQDADIVAFLYRPEYYGVTLWEDGTPTAGMMEFIISKNRNGACSSVMLKFLGKYTKVTDFESGPPPQPMLPLAQAKDAPKSYKDFQVGRRELVDDKDEDENTPPF